MGKKCLILFTFINVLLWLPISLGLPLMNWGPYSVSESFKYTTHTLEASFGTPLWINKTIQVIHAQAQNLSPEVLKVGLKAYVQAKKLGVNTKPLLTLVDYTKPSKERRLWVIDLKNLKVLFNTYVAHGSNSGRAKPTSFSNRAKSLKSSIGVFLTAEPYMGGNGYSLRVQGLEEDFNDNAYRRSIVFHGAAYVNESLAKNNGMVGRSWGCFAVERNLIKPIINTIKQNSLVVAYYPDQNWLQSSKFVNKNI